MISNTYWRGRFSPQEELSGCISHNGTGDVWNSDRRRDKKNSHLIATGKAHHNYQELLVEH